MNNHTPYTYLIGWSSLNIYYYGRRSSKGCTPSNFWIKYKTSSKYVKVFTSIHGDPDIIQIRKTFTDSKKCAAWECKVLRRINAAKDERFLNKTNGDKNWGSFDYNAENNPNYGKFLYHNKEMSKSQYFFIGEQPTNWILGSKELHPSVGMKLYHNKKTNQHKYFDPLDPPSDEWKIGRSENIKALYKKPNESLRGATVFYNKQTNHKIFLHNNEDIPSGYVRGGCPMSKTSKALLSKTHKGKTPYHNTLTDREIRLNANDVVPEGYIKGRSKTFINSLKNKHRSRNKFILPHGEFNTIKEAYLSTKGSLYQVSRGTLLEYFNDLSKEITHKMYYRSKYIKYFFDQDCIGMKLYEVGFKKE